jgi:hypothetical protein
LSIDDVFLDLLANPKADNPCLLWKECTGFPVKDPQAFWSLRKNVPLIFNSVVELNLFVGVAMAECYYVEIPTGGQILPKHMTLSCLVSYYIEYRTWKREFISYSNHKNHIIRTYTSQLTRECNHFGFIISGINLLLAYIIPILKRLIQIREDFS